uniref:Uncharacterized protein n=1 Tax=Panagrolaimus sp. JU765 TaxID=591449 RepID=A0AC34Q088_9BILA
KKKKKCNVHDNFQRHCHIGTYGDCEWARGHYDIFKFDENTNCGQHDSWDICVRQIWTPKDDPTRVCHKYLCHHDYVNHGEELIYNKYPNVTNSSMTDEIENAKVQVEQCIVTDRSKSCFEVEKPPKIKCYKSDSKELGDPVECSDYVTHCRWTQDRDGMVLTRGCSPMNVAPGKERCFEIGGVYTCDAPGNASNANVDAPKECYTGVEGNCTYFFKREIVQRLYHAPIKTQCSGWSHHCYKSEFHGDGAKCALYDCDVFTGNADYLDFQGQDTVVNTFVRGDSNITWSVTTARCEGESCNAKLICEGDDCIKHAANSGNKLILMAVYFMVAIQGLG